MIDLDDGESDEGEGEGEDGEGRIKKRKKGNDFLTYLICIYRASKQQMAVIVGCILV